MPREIKFRSKRVDNGEWVYGGSIIRFGDEVTEYYMPQYREKCRCEHDESDNIVSFIGGMFYKLDPETVGQFTGLKGKNGKEIYEGDIVKAWSQGICGKFKVIWRREGSPCWILYPAWRNGRFWYLHGTLHKDGYWYDNVEVIGNIYDNPELLQEAAK